MNGGKQEEEEEEAMGKAASGSRECFHFLFAPLANIYRRISAARLTDREGTGTRGHVDVQTEQSRNLPTARHHAAILN